MGAGLVGLAETPEGPLFAPEGGCDVLEGGREPCCRLPGEAVVPPCSTPDLAISEGRTGFIETGACDTRLTGAGIVVCCGCCGCCVVVLR